MVESNQQISKGLRLVLPPEASTNWLFNEYALFNILTMRHIVIMDKADFRRYERLATISDIDFLKYYLLTILKRIGVICLRDYSKIYHQKLIEQNLQSINESKILNLTSQYEAEILQGYINYLESVVSAKKLS